MKTAEEKAKDFLDLIYLVVDIKGGHNGWFLQEIESLLKEQDKDTRHACAEAMHEIVGVGYWHGKAYNACMNVKAV